MLVDIMLDPSYFEAGGGLLRHLGKAETDKVIWSNVLL